MKKGIVFLIVLSLGVMGLMAEGMDNLPVYLVCNDGGASYECTLSAITFYGVAVYTIDVLPSGNGILLVNMADNSFQINVFGGGMWYAYCQVGVISKPCATAYNANENGGMFQTTICLGYATADATSTSPNLRKK